MVSLQRWQAVWQQLGAAADDELFIRVREAYQEPHRQYHTLQHLDECLRHFDTLKDHAIHPAEVELALWFHDAIYALQEKSNELRSAEWAQESILKRGVSADVGMRVHGLIMMTVHNAVPDTRDAQALIDVDLAIFSATPTRFDEYERQVREEYAWVPDDFFRRERGRILQEFLNRKHLYSTPLFRQHHEAQARANLQRSIKNLTG